MLDQCGRAKFYNLILFPRFKKNLPIEKANKGEATALPGVLVLGYVDVTNTAVLLEEILQVTVAGAVGQIVHLQRYHPKI